MCRLDAFCIVFFFNDTATTEIYTLSLHDALPIQPIEWYNDSEPFALLGDTSWTNYTVSSDVLLKQAGAVELIGRAGLQGHPQSHQSGYYLRVSDTGTWKIVRNDTSGQLRTLADGTAPPLGIGNWHTLALS